MELDINPIHSVSFTVNIPDYFAIIESSIVLGRIDDIITPGSWKLVTNKMLYQNAAKS